MEEDDRTRMDESKLDAEDMETLRRLSRGHVIIHIRVLYVVCALMSVSVLVSHVLYRYELRSVKETLGKDLVELRREHEGLLLEGLKVKVAMDMANRTRGQRGKRHPGVNGVRANGDGDSSMISRLKRMVADGGGGGRKDGGEEEVEDAGDEEGGDGQQQQQQQQHAKDETYDYTTDDYGSGVTTSGMHETSFWISSDSRLPVAVVKEYCYSMSELCPPGRTGSPGEQGLPGPPGLTGDQGPTGNQGIQGIAGEKGSHGEKGERGHEGPEGPPGELGFRGYPGSDGFPGEKGDKGDHGIKGETGVPGPDGPPGATGPVGQPGPQGLIGDPGAPGDLGLPGLQGESGPMGEQGMKGADGLTGPQGPKGQAGPQGEMGVPGVAGDVGPKGDQGNVGEPGIPGMPGQTGDKGDRGKHGSKGEQGPEGTSGVNGEPGIPGDPGAKGDKGEFGIPGPRGDPGEPGMKGKSGLVGAPGDSGDIGPPGPAGPAGEKGKRGKRGELGPKADKGEPGPSGEKGDSGDQGPKGDQGSKGDQGPRGDRGSKGDKGDVTVGAAPVQRSPDNRGARGLPGPPGLPGPRGEPGFSCGCETTEGTTEEMTTTPPTTTVEPTIEPRLLECRIQKIGKPLYHKYTNTYWGTWMRDTKDRSELGDKFWMTKHFTGKLLYSYANLDKFKQDDPETIYELTELFFGTGHVIYDSSFIYHRSGFSELVKYDLVRNVTLAKVYIPRAVYQGKDYVYYTEYNFFDLSVDENGLWAVYAAEAEPNSLFVSKLNTEDLHIEKTWDVPVKHHDYGNGFVSCGMLYLLKDTTSKETTIDFAYDLYTKQMVQLVNLKFNNPFQMNNMVSYNPVERKIYSWDKGNLLTYPLLVS